MADPDDRSFDAEPPTLGEGVPANVDLTKLGQRGTPEEDWGDAEPEAQHGGNHAARPERTEALKGQGAKTRTANKDIVSRRG